MSNATLPILDYLYELDLTLFKKHSIPSTPQILIPLRSHKFIANGEFNP